MTPGTQPQHVSKKTIKTEPHPLSITAKGGKNNDNKTRRQDMMVGGTVAVIKVKKF